MKYTFNRCKKEGVYFRPWVERVIDLCEGEGVIPPEHKELDKLYRENFNYEEALLHAKFKTTRLTWMELHIKNDKGVHVERFNNLNQAKEFFAKFPKLRKKLENG